MNQHNETLQPAKNIGSTHRSILETDMSAVIIGSFRKHFHEIIELRKALELLGVAVLSPKNCNITNPDGEFIIFESDSTSDAKLLQAVVFTKIKYSTFVVLANFDDYIGRATTLEIGYAVAHGIPIFSLKPVKDIHLQPYCRLLAEVFNSFSSFETGKVLDAIEGNK
jgi:nucleoside 2-deoxyribosyltransferase